MLSSDWMKCAKGLHPILWAWVAGSSLGGISRKLLFFFVDGCSPANVTAARCLGVGEDLDQPLSCP